MAFCALAEIARAVKVVAVLELTEGTSYVKPDFFAPQS